MGNTQTILPTAVVAWDEPALNAARTVQYSKYIHEMMGHSGVAYTALAQEEVWAALPSLSILVSVGHADLPEDRRAALLDWIRQGGCWITIAGTSGLEAALGLELEPPSFGGFGSTISTLGEGYMMPQDAAHPILAHLTRPLHFFSGIPLRLSEGTPLAGISDAHQRPTERVGIHERRIGDGLCIVIAMDITGTVVRIQQGLPITRDGVSAPDGTAPVCDDVLKSGDGGVLDWLFDREPVPGVKGLPAYLQPIADQWTEVVLRAIFYCAQQKAVALAVLWLYPRNLPALAHMSHDTDGNDPELARIMIDTIQEGGIQSTWCVIDPPYAPEILKEIRSIGGELAMHYDAMSPGLDWSEQEFDRQFQTLIAAFGAMPINTNKNHYLRWEGDMELFAWCAKHGIRVDESKGPAKSGEAGFNFGTCHPYFPISFRGEIMEVMELCTHTQDLIVFAPEAVRTPLLEAVVKHHGILHLLFHPSHIGKPEMRACVLRSIEAAREKGLEWWTATQIHAWECARRKAQWQGLTPRSARLELGSPLPEATVLLLDTSLEKGHINDKQYAASKVERWSFEFTAFTLDDTPCDQIDLRIKE